MPKRAACLLLLLAAPLAWAERAVTIGEYSEEVRAKVAAVVTAALKEAGREARVSGVVTYASGGVFFLQKDEDGIKVLAAGRGRLPKPGAWVTVFGSPTLEGGRVVFRADRWSVEGERELPAARPVSVADLLGENSISNSVNWLRVTVAGRAIGVTDNGFAINVDGIPVNVMTARTPPFLQDSERTHPIVEVSGVAELMLDQSALLGANRDVMGVKINVNGPGDIGLREDWQYLARRRDGLLAKVAAVAIGVLALALAFILLVVLRQRRRLFRDRTVMAERKRMADDIHDTIEQHLVGAGMLLKLNRLKEAQEVLVRAKREIRDIVWGLKNDDMMRQSPSEMLRQLAHDENTKGICRVDTRLTGLPNAMNASMMRDLSLIVREAIGNAVKHGGAKRIAISADPGEIAGWTIRIANDGEQFDPAAVKGPAEGHFGLEGMRQRACRLGATVTFAQRKTGMVLILEKRQ